MIGWPVSVMYLAASYIFIVASTVVASTAPSMVPCCNRRQHVAERHRDRRRAEPLHHFLLHVGRQHTKLLALEIGKVADRRARNDRRRLRDEQRHAMDALVGAEREHHLLHFRIGRHPDGVRHAVDEARRGHHFVAGVDADQKFGRTDIALNGAELNALDLARDRPQLARRINLALDAAAGILLDHGDEILAPLMLRLVDRGGAELHHISLVLGARRIVRRGERQQQSSGCGRRLPADFTVQKTHIVLPWVRRRGKRPDGARRRMMIAKAALSKTLAGATGAA